MKHARRMGCQSSQDQQIMLLKSLLAIVGDRKDSENIWAFADVGPYDAMIVDYDGRDDRHVDACASVCQVQVPMSRDEALLYGQELFLSKPLRSRDLVMLLDSLDKKVSRNNALAKPDNNFNRPDQAFSQSIDLVSGDGKLKKIMGVIKNKSPDYVRVDFDGAFAVIDAVNDQIFLEKDFNFSRATLSENISFSKVDSEMVDISNCISTADFFYEYTMNRDYVFLLDGIDKNYAFYIKQWPRFMRMTNTKSLIKVSAYFSRRRSRFDVALKDLMCDVKQLSAFLNAAHAQNLLFFDVNVAAESVVAGQAMTVVKNGIMMPEKVGIFGRIRQRLGI